jgi:MFS family permease
VVASAARFVAATLHLLRTPAPLVNLRTLRIPTFSAAITGSSLFWLVVGAIPFLLPLLFQTVFGWSAIKSGSVVLFVFVGNITIKPATTWLFNRFGFRTMLLVSTVGLAATAFAAGLLTADTPVAVMVLVCLVSGVARSVGLTGYTTLGPATHHPTRCATPTRWRRRSSNCSWGSASRPPPSRYGSARRSPTCCRAAPAPAPPTPSRSLCWD